MEKIITKKDVEYVAKLARIHIPEEEKGKYESQLERILEYVSQLKKIEKLITMRRKNAAYLSKQLKDVEEISLPSAPRGYRHIFQMYTIYVKSGKTVRNALQKHLNKQGIMAKVYFPPVHLSQFYKKSFGYKKGDLPQTEKIADSVLTLPMYPELSKGDMDIIAKEVHKFFS